MGSFVQFVRLSAQTVYPFIRLSVYPFVCPLLHPPFVSLFLCWPIHQFNPPFIHPSVFPFVSSVRPSTHPSSFLALFCQFIRSYVSPFRLSFHSYTWVSISPSINVFVYLSVWSSRTSIRSVLLTIRLSVPFCIRLLWPSVCLSALPSIHPSCCPFVHLFVRPSIRPSVHPSNHLSIYNGSSEINLTSRNLLLQL